MCRLFCWSAFTSRPGLITLSPTSAKLPHNHYGLNPQPFVGAWKTARVIILITSAVKPQALTCVEGQ